MTPEQSDTLSKLSQQMDDLIVVNTKEHEVIKITQDDIYVKLDAGKTEMYNALNNRPKWSVTMWLIGGVFASLMTIGWFVYHIDTNIENHIDAGVKVWMKDNPGKEAPDLRGD